MASRSAIAKKAWKTRRMNAAKKRGVKPGTKRGPYKKARKLKITALANSLKMGDAVSIPYNEWAAMNKSFMKATEPTTSVGNLPSLISELQSSISQLEGQLTAQIDRIKSILV